MIRETRIKYTVSPDPVPQPLGSPLDPVVEWMQAHPWKVLFAVLPVIVVFVGLIEVPL